MQTGTGREEARDGMRNRGRLLVWQELREECWGEEQRLWGREPGPRGRLGRAVWWMT